MEESWKKENRLRTEVKWLEISSTETEFFIIRAEKEIIELFQEGDF